MIHAAVLCWLTMLPSFCVGRDPLPEGIIVTDSRPVSDAVMLTRPDGTPIWVNPHAIAYIRAPLDSEPDGHTTLVFTSGGKQTVLETVDEIKALVGDRLKRE
jgi:uncharacterized protein YlzI (FlbEa/FlbD family)